MAPTGAIFFEMAPAGAIFYGSLDMASALPTLQAIARIATDSGLLHTAANGTAAQKVQTENGPIPTLAGALATLVGFTLRGAWVTGTQYAVKDIYTADGIAYLVIEAHVSTSVAIDQAAGRVVVYQGIPPVEFSTRISRIVASVSELETLPAAGYSTVFTIGYYGSGSRGQRMYVADPSDTTTPPDRGLVFQAADGGRFKLVHYGSITPFDFGARGDGVVGQKQGADDTDALEGMLQAWSPSLAIDIDGITFNFSRQLKKVGVNLTLKTAGASNTIFNWIGGDGTGVTDQNALDLIVFGDGDTECSNWDIGGFGVESAVSVKGGAAVRIRKMMKGSVLRGFQIGYVSENGNLFHGVWLDVVNVIELPAIYATKLQGDGLRFNGTATDDTGSDLFIGKGNISFCANGLHQGGGFGGLRTGQLNCFANGINYLFDTTIVPHKNREVFIGPESVCDGATIAGVVFDDALTGGAPVTLSGFIGSSGQQGGGAGPHHGVWVKNWRGGRFNVNSGQIFNHLGDAIRVDDASIVMSIAAETHIFNNGGYGINPTVVMSGIYCDSRYMSLNALGDFSANFRNPSWDSFETAVTSSAGPLAQIGSVNLFYRLTGGVCHFTVNITIATNGTGAGSIQFALPREAAGFGTVYGKELKTGKALTGIVAASNMEQLTFYDNTYPGSDGAVLVVSGSYQYR